MNCPKCNEEKNNRGFVQHVAACKGGGVAVMENKAPDPLSRRGRQRYSDPIPTALEQVRTTPNGVYGAWAYYLRPAGATIREALVLYPNGGIPDNADAKVRGKYGNNASYYRDRQAAKGFKFLGTKLTSEGVRELVKTLESNREDECLYMQDVINDANYQLTTVSNPAWRDVFQKRKEKAQKRLELLQQEWDPEALVKELDEISRAQRLASLDPNVLAVMREMVGEVNEKMVAYFQAGRSSAVEGVSTITRGGDPGKGLDA